MTGLEALNKFVNVFAEYCVKTQHQEMNATNMQTAVEYLARSEECRTIEKSLKALEIIKKKHVNVGLVKTLGSVEQYNQTYVYDNMLNVNWCLTKEEFDTLKRGLESE